MIDNDGEVKDALFNIALSIAKDLIKRMKYDYHFIGYIVGVNDDGTFDVYSNEKEGNLYGIKSSTPSSPIVGDVVQIRETKNVPDSYLIDYIERKG